MTYAIGNTGNNMIDGDDGSHPASPNHNEKGYCRYCGCRIDYLNYSEFDSVCEDCTSEHEQTLLEDEQY